ncbi:MAG: TonB-dependent receptor [Gammaproteobacteria bacterium]|nr:TonB-dependent receptor [Gammaproteobacteria bacterium]
MPAPARSRSAWPQFHEGEEPVRTRPDSIRTALLRTVATAAALALAWSGQALAQDAGDGEAIDEITVTGTQIKGARISDALAVSVISADDIEILGVESGDELLDMIPELGQNYFSETDTAGGVNAARGDVGAINMRNLGTGNTLVLLNGRRLVNMATFQTEEVGGSFVPVNSVNSNHIPVYGVERIEVLRDGASAIYGADAVAGVLNTVLQDDYEGFTIRGRFTDYDNLPRNDETLAIQWGTSFNGGATHVGLFAHHYRRDSVNSKDDPRWSNSDFRYRFPDDSPFATRTRFRNDSANSPYGRFDVIPGLSSSHSLRAEDVVDTSGEFELFPADHPSCAGTSFILASGVCSREDATSRGIRYNINGEGAGRDLLSDLERTTVYGYLNHEFDSGLEIFGDFYWYDSATVRTNDSTIDLSAVPLRVGASNYYNPLGRALIDGQPNPNRIPDPTGAIYADVPDEGYELNMDLYRFDEYPRITDNDGEAIRVVAGLRGTLGDWDWESAIIWSEATRDETTHNRLSNTLITQALFDPTPAAYNPFSANVDSNIERALIDVYRNGESTLKSWDVKFSNPEWFNLFSRPVGFVAGVEIREEEYVDDRDPRLDGTIRFMRESDPINNPGVFDIEGDFQGDVFPEVSDVVRSSPTLDGAGSRKTNSLFAEFQLPITDTLDVQLAGRYEDFDDIGDTTVGKLAFGWRPLDWLLVRGSWSEAFRAPNLITINEAFVARSNTLNDWVCQYAQDNGTIGDACDDAYGIQRQAQGSKELVPEESINTSVGFVLQPHESVSFTFDMWSIEKDGTIGLFGEENHILYDLVLRLDAGTANCSDPSSLGSPVVVRGAYDPDDADLVNGFLDVGLCPVGEVDFVTDKYTNLDTRKLEGFDIGIYWNVETESGDWAFKYNGSFYDVFEQTASGELSTTILAAQDENSAIAAYQLEGLGDLLGIDGNQKSRHSASISWRKEDWGASLQGFRISSFNEVLPEGLFLIPAMTTYNTKVDYNFDVGETDMRIRLGVNNISDRRAPLADESFGFWKDAHRDWGRYWYVDLRITL